MKLKNFPRTSTKRHRSKKVWKKNPVKQTKKIDSEVSIGASEEENGREHIHK